MNTYIYRAVGQPATDFVDHNGPEPMRFQNSPGRLLWCQCCDKRHPARDVVVHCYYDCWMFFCAPGRGCKHQRVIEAKRRREFKNRSRGNKAAWARRRAHAA